MSTSAVMIREQPADRRREERWRVRFGVRWLDARQGERPLSVLDLSASGFQIEIEIDQVLPVGTCIIVEMPDGVCKVCRIVWNSGNYHGAQFSEPLNVAQLDSLLSARLTTWPSAAEPLNAAEIGPLVQGAGHDGSCDDVDGRVPFATGARLIGGTAAILWAMLGAGLWLVAE